MQTQTVLIVAMLTKVCLPSFMVIGFVVVNLIVAGVRKGANNWTSCNNCIPSSDIRHTTLASSSRRRRLQNSVVHVHVKTREALCAIDEKFLSFSIDAIEMKRKFRCFPTKWKRLNVLAKSLSPAYLRIGGTPQDFATFELDEYGDNRGFLKNKRREFNCTPHFENWRVLKPYTLSVRYFDQMAQFAKRNDLQLIFGLNGLTHRHKDGSWDGHHSQILHEHARMSNYSVFWSLGNEPNRYSKYGTRYPPVSPQQLSRDYQKLKEMVTDDKIVGPGVTSKSRGVKFLKNFLLGGGEMSLAAVTYHHYFMHQSVSTVQKYVIPTLLNKLEQVRGFDRGSATVSVLGTLTFDHDPHLLSVYFFTYTQYFIRY